MNYYVNNKMKEMLGFFSVKPTPVISMVTKYSSGKSLKAFFSAIIFHSIRNILFLPLAKRYRKAT